MVESAKYVDKDGGVIVVANGIEQSVPFDSRSPLRQELAAWEAEGNTIAPYVEPVIDWDAVDFAEVSAALTRPGSVVRALGLLLLQEINKLRVKNGDAAYTMQQFKDALRAQIR